AYVFLRSKKDCSTDNTAQTSQESALNLSSLKAIISSKTIWLLAIANLLLVGSLEGFADVWGVQYLIESYGMGKSDAAGIISFIFIGMLFGGPTLAWLSEKFGDAIVIALCGVFMALIFFAMLAGFIPAAILPYAFFLVGIMCCYQVLVFSVGSKLVSPASLGICVAFLNSINMLGGSFYHTIIGRAMDIFWQGAYSALGCKVYDINAYTKALNVIPVCALIGAALFIGFARIQRQGKLKPIS
ncbi:MAG: MFS transporter, partial [Alphaproteobacteria bacterium]|nr:MFS transporter [Alphaproteobacteria bacterium]